MSSVENVSWNPELSILSWSPPLFRSSDTNTEDFIYDIILNGDSLDNTTNNSIPLNIPVCENFNVSITVFFGQYVSLENSKLINDTGSKLQRYIYCRNELSISFIYRLYCQNHQSCCKI